MKNSLILFLAVFALIVLSGCIYPATVADKLCSDTRNYYGRSVVRGCGSQLQTQWDDFVNGTPNSPACGGTPPDDLGQYPQGCEWWNTACQCEMVRGMMRSPFSDDPPKTGFYKAKSPTTNLVEFTCNFQCTAWDYLTFGWPCMAGNTYPTYNLIKPCTDGTFCVDSTQSADGYCTCTPESCQPFGLRCRNPNQPDGHCSAFDCRIGDPCNPPTPKCNPTDGQCVQCLIDADCPQGQTCKPDHTCSATPPPNCQQTGCPQGQCCPPGGTSCINFDCTICGCSSPLHCKVDTKQCVECLSDGDCSTGQRCVNNQCTTPTCPQECKDLAKTSFTCGKYPKECCGGGQGTLVCDGHTFQWCDKTGLKPECASDLEVVPGEYCCTNWGTCQKNGEPPNWSCGCPAECNDPRANIQCNTAIPPSPHCDQINCPLGRFQPAIGFKCDDPNKRCATYNGTTDCWSADQITCGQQVPTFLQPSLLGLFCDDSPNFQHKLCDLGGPTCLPVLTGAPSYPLKYLYDLAINPEKGLAYNTWFKFRIGPNSGQPNGGMPNDNFPNLEKQKLFGFDYAQQPDPASAFNLVLTNSTKPPFKEGLMRFELENSQLSGPMNYALVKMEDLTNPTKGAPGNQKTERFIFKLNAGYSGKCVPEDRSFKGESGWVVKPRTSFDWRWHDINSQLKQCDYNNLSGAYCDATQFAIVLFARLQKMRELSDAGQTSLAADLKEFDANLVKDGFTQDFLLDFNFLSSYSMLFGAPPWFKNEWSSYLGNPMRISFENKASDKNPSDLTQIVSPGRYQVRIIPTWSAGDWVFFQNNEPKAQIKVEFVQKIADPNPMHPLYLLPFDGQVGTKRPEEGEANRQGYGVTVSGAELPLYTISDVTYSAFSVGTGQLQVQKIDSFPGTNELSQRGKLLSINFSNNSITFAPVTATPVAMKIEGGLDSLAQGFFSVNDNPSHIVSPGNGLSAAAWGGIGSKNLGNPVNPCMGFHDQPLFFRRSDKAPGSEACTTIPDTRGFWWDGVGNEQALFLETVFYTPAGAFSLANQCDGTKARWVSPAGVINNGSLGSAFNLDFSETQNWKIGTLEGILLRLGEGRVCQHQSLDGQTITFFWDRNELVSRLDNSRLSLIGMSPGNRCQR